MRSSVAVRLEDDRVSRKCSATRRRLIGIRTDCGALDKHDADVIGLIWDGPRRRDGSPLWNGIDRAALIHPPFVSAGGGSSPFADGKIGDLPNLPVSAFELQFDDS